MSDARHRVVPIAGVGRPAKILAGCVNRDASAGVAAALL
jgi:hypothetical protein